MGTVVTFKSMADKSQQMSSESCVKRDEKNTILSIIESDESYMSTEEYSSNSPIVHKSCQLHTSTEFPKHLNWILSSANKLYGQSYCSNSTCHWCQCDENIVPVHKIEFAVMVLTSLVLKTRQWLERCLQYTNHQVVTQRSEIQFRLCAAVVETKYLVRELTFLAIDVNHTTGTADQSEGNESRSDDNDDCGGLSLTDQN
ncbi:Uncharacterized protein FWK35_00008241, partial [Aphis craccivora]